MSNAYELMTEEQRAALPVCELIPLAYDERMIEVVADNGNRCVTVLQYPPGATALRFGCITIDRETFRIAEHQLPDLRAAYEARIAAATKAHIARFLMEA